MPRRTADSSRSDPARPNLHDIHQVAIGRLLPQEQRYTSSRRAIVSALAAAPAPVTISELLDAGEGLTQSSTYRNLAVLEEAGVVHRIVTASDHARFELAEDVTGAHHHHLVCVDCGVILDITLPDSLETSLHRALADAAAGEGFVGTHHRIDLLGRCAACAA